MEIVGVLQEAEPRLPDLTKIIKVRDWFLRGIEDIASVLEAMAAHDNRLDV